MTEYVTVHLETIGEGKGERNGEGRREMGTEKKSGRRRGRARKGETCLMLTTS